MPLLLMGSSQQGIIILGYMGIIFLIIHIVRLSHYPQKLKYTSSKEKETLIQTKEAFRYSGVLTITMGALPCAALMYAEGALSGVILHFFILAAAYAILFYAYITLKEKNARAPPPPTMQRTFEEIRFLTKTYKKILDVNDGVLFMLCFSYMLLESSPRSWWAVFAVALTLAVIHGLSFLSERVWQIDLRHIYIWVDYRKPKYRRIVQGGYIILCWLTIFRLLGWV